jgi:glycosyltransferase involved in cell wall biosynthesis
MRILLISRCPPYPLYLGDRLIVWHLADELEGRRHQLDLLAFTQRPEDRHDVDHYDMRFDHVELFEEPRGRRALYLKRALLPQSHFPKQAEDSRSAVMWRAIERLIASKDYDLVHLFGGVQVYEFFHALRGLPTVITPYESYSLYLKRMVETSPFSPMQRFQHTLARQFESWMFTPYQRTVVVSQPDKDELLSINPSLRVEVIPNGIDLYHFRRVRGRKKAPALLFVGNYEYAPNVDAALRLAHAIFPQVRAVIPEVKLWLVGNAPPPELQQLVSASIKVTGRVPDVRAYLARATAFVCPLRFGAGIKNKVLEALAIGCPVVATPLSVDGIDVRDGHDVLLTGDEDMPATIVRLMRDKPLQAQLADNGRRLIEERYSWSRVADLYEMIYKDITS